MPQAFQYDLDAPFAPANAQGLRSTATLINLHRRLGGRRGWSCATVPLRGSPHPKRQHHIALRGELQPERDLDLVGPHRPVAYVPDHVHRRGRHRPDRRLCPLVRLTDRVLRAAQLRGRSKPATGLVSTSNSTSPIRIGTTRPATEPPAQQHLQPPERSKIIGTVSTLHFSDPGWAVHNDPGSAVRDGDEGELSMLTCSMRPWWCPRELWR